MSDTPQNEQVIEQVEVVSVDDVAKIVDDATSSAGSEAVEAIGSEVAEVSGKVDSVGDYVAGIDARLAKVEEGFVTLGAQSDDGANAVMLTDDQWLEMQQAWGWAKSCASFGVFLLLVCVLLVAANFGSKLWSTFVAGWRHG